MTFTQQHLDLLVCPACHHPLLLEPPGIRCSGCARLYPIVDGLPRLIAGAIPEETSRE